MIKRISMIVGVFGVVLTCLGIFVKIKGADAISVIGGADGPTSIFIAGKVSGGVPVGMIIVGVLLAVVGILLLKWK